MEETEDEKNELLEALRGSSPELEIKSSPLPAVVQVTIPEVEGDSEEAKAVKNNAEFVVNSAKVAVDVLQQLAVTGNPRYFETIARLLQEITASNNQLIQLHKVKSDTAGMSGGKKVPNPQVNVNVLPSGGTTMMSTSDMIKTVSSEEAEND